MDDWLILSIQVGIIEIYAITKKVFKGWNIITDKNRYNGNIRMPKSDVNVMEW